MNNLPNAKLRVDVSMPKTHTADVSIHSHSFITFIHLHSLLTYQCRRHTLLTYQYIHIIHSSLHSFITTFIHLHSLLTHTVDVSMPNTFTVDNNFSPPKQTTQTTAFQSRKIRKVYVFDLLFYVMRLCLLIFLLIHSCT